MIRPRQPFQDGEQVRVGEAEGVEQIIFLHQVIVQVAQTLEQFLAEYLLDRLREIGVEQRGAVTMDLRSNEVEQFLQARTFPAGIRVGPTARG